MLLILILGVFSRQTRRSCYSHSDLVMRINRHFGDFLHIFFLQMSQNLLDAAFSVTRGCAFSTAGEKSLGYIFRRKKRTKTTSDKKRQGWLWGERGWGVLFQCFSN